MKNIIRIIDFYSPNCSPCQMIKKNQNSFENVEYINVMEDLDKALEFNIRKSPTVVFLKDGEETARFTGFKQKKKQPLIQNK